MMRQVRRLAVGGVLMLLAAMATAGSALNAPPPSCNLADLQLRSSTVNQGLGSYQRIVRGKETLVRLYFSMPQCHDNNDSIQITGGTLSVTGAGGSLATNISGTPGLVSAFPTAATYTAASPSGMLDSPADIKFVVDGDLLKPAGTEGAFEASFSANISFRFKTTATGALSSEQVKPFNGFASKTVERKTNALRILVVPMGDATNAYSTEFPASAVAAVENGMQTLSRLFPVPDGVGTLGSDSGGVRYALSPTLLNIGAAPFCGSTGFATMKNTLAQFLLSWNTANPSATADRVLGVVAQANYAGGACPFGMASFGTPEAWAVAFDDPASSPGTGALFGMELAHTFGIVPPARDNANDVGHSPTTGADSTSPNRGFNVPMRSFLANDATVMTLGATWNNTNTLLERDDYAALLCALGGQVTADCPVSGTAGTATGVGASSVVSVSGTTDGTTATFLESYIAPGAQTLPDDDSEYRLVQRNSSGGVLRNDGVPVSFTETHDGEDSSGLFAVAFPFAPGAVRVELRKGGPDGALLESIDESAPPTIESFEVTAGGATPEKYTDTFAQSEFDPMLSVDRRWVTWEAGSAVYIAPIDDSTPPTLVPSPGGGEIPDPLSDPAWSQATGDSLELAYIANGDIYTVDVDVSGEAPTFGTPTRVHDSATRDRSASDPSWNQDGTKIAFTDGTINVLDIATQEVREVTPFGGVDDPSWSRTSGDDRIAFTAVGIEGPSNVMVVDPAEAEPDPTLLIENAFEPAWGTDGRISFTRPSEQVWTKIVGEVEGGETQVVLNGYGSDLVGNTLIFTRDFPTGGEFGEQSDLMLMSLAAGNVSVNVSDPDNADDLVLDLLVDCGDLVYVAAVALEPSEVSGTSALWQANFDPSLTCENPTLKIAVTDQWNRVPSSGADQEEEIEAEQKDPTAAIYSPLPGATFRQYDVIPAWGSGWDAEDGTIPSADLDWVLEGPAGFTTRLGEGTNVDFSPLVAGGFPLGDYTLTLIAKDSEGNTSEPATRSFTVVADADNDGMTIAEESLPCITYDSVSFTSPDLDPLNAFRDDDTDGIPNLDDAAACTAATSYEAIVNVDSEVSASRAMGVVTAFVTLQYRDIRAVDPASVRITNISGVDVSSDPRLVAIRWTVDKNGVGTAKFDRTKLLQVFAELGLDSGTVTLTIGGTGGGGAWSFAGSDTTVVRSN